MEVQTRTVISAGLDPSQFEQGAQRITESMQRMAASSSQSVGQMSRVFADTGRGFQSLASQFSDGFRNASQFTQKVQDAYRALGGAGRDQLGLLPGILDNISAKYGIMGDAARRAALTMGDAAATQQQRLQAFQSLLPGGGAAAPPTALVALSAAHDRVATSSRAASFAVRDFGVQMIDIGSQLTSGAPIMVTLIQQLSQVGQVAAVSGVSLGTLARGIGDALLSALRFILSPLGLLLTGLASLATAAFIVGSRVVELAAEHKSLTLAIEGSGRSAAASVPQFEAYIARLRQVGVASADAVKLSLELARTPGISSRQIGQVQSLAPIIPTIAAAGGDSAIQVQKSIAEAVSGHRSAIEALDKQYNLFTVSELANIDAMIKAKGAGADLSIVIDRLNERFRGMESPLSDAGRATLSLSNAWGEFVDRIAKSEPVIAIVQRLTNALRDANVSDLTGQLTKLQGQQIEQQRAVQDAPGTGLGSYKARAQFELDATNQQLVAVQKRIDDMTMRSVTVTAPAGIGARQGTVPFGPGTTADALEMQNKATFATAQQKAGTSDAVRVRELNDENRRNLALLQSLGPRTLENAAAEDTLRHAIEANDKALASMNKTKAVAQTSLQKQGDTLDAQIRAQLELADAYGKGDAAVQQILATQAAEKQLISDGLAKNKNYNDLLADRTAKFLALAQATGAAQFEQTLQNTKDQVDAQVRVNQAFDGTELSISHATNMEKAYADLLKDHIIPGTAEFIEKQRELAAVLDRGVQSNKDFGIALNASNELANAASQAFDTIGNSLTQAFVSGQVDANTFLNVFKAVVAQIIQEAMRLSILNPILNAVFPGSQHRTTAADVFGGAGGAVTGGAFNTAYAALGDSYLLAKGGVFQSPSLSAYSNLVVSQPTLFDTGLSGFRAYAQGGTGLFGEAGPEAVVPLVKGPDGNLGIRSSGAGTGVVVNNNTSVTVNSTGGQQGKLDPAALRQMTQQVEIAVTNATRKALVAEMRPGGDLFLR